MINVIIVFLFIFHFLQSHEIGPGPEFERVGFNLLGRSPLVTHFLKMRELMGKEQQPVQPVGRTEVAKLQYPFKLRHICSVVPCLYGHGLDTPCGGYLDIRELKQRRR